ncbi:hypothetical protein BJ878DRAFT_523490, partial [Calycina marina]
MGLMPIRATGHLWAVLLNFRWRAWKARARRTSPKRPVEAPVWILSGGRKRSGRRKGILAERYTAVILFLEWQ